MGELSSDSTKTERIVSLIRFVEICQRRELEIARAFGLSPGEYRCLVMFLREPEHSIKELAEGLGVGPSRLSRILDKLEDRGLIVRTLSRKDRRNVRVTLSARGADMVVRLGDNAAQAYAPVAAAISSGIRPLTTDVLYQALVSLASHWQENPKEETSSYGSRII
jgi:DNA-binding MarR family transcriptional regulator